ncbi:hypothetical protein R70006_06112 [Paraburkholderia domus]|jgi:hypothetical protein|nr:hypothetical protein R70006_06112 [Paraburkholderia domus]
MRIVSGNQRKRSCVVSLTYGAVALGYTGKDATRATVLDGAVTVAAGLLVSIHVSFNLFPGGLRCPSRHCWFYSVTVMGRGGWGTTRNR